MLTAGIAGCVAMTTLGVHLAPSFATILLPQHIALGTTIIRITVLALPMVALNIALVYSLQAVGRHDIAARIGVAASLASAAMSVIAILTAGITGASWALVARPTILAAALAPAFQRAFPGLLGRLPWFRIALAGAALLATCELLPHTGLLKALASAAAGGIVYVALLLMMRVLTVTDVVALVARERDA